MSVEGLIDLSSDTSTRPTKRMYEAMIRAKVGDEQKRADPTVNRLCERVASMLGKEAAVFLPSGVMCNMIGILLQCNRGDVVLTDKTAHILTMEGGAPAAIGGVMVHSLPGNRGIFSANEVEAAISKSPKKNVARTGLISIEQTSNRGGGSIWPLETIREIARVAAEYDIPMHMDGARILNASVATGIAPRDYAAEFDTLWLDLSKGLGCPVGAVFAGSENHIEEAWRWKHRLGGAMRQAGVLAAAGLYALDNHVERLAEDHENARLLVAGLDRVSGVESKWGVPDTNMVFLDVEQSRLDATQWTQALQAKGISVGIESDTELRAVTHLDVTSQRVAAVPESATVAIADLAARMRRDGHQVVDFSAGRAAEHSPEIVCEAAIEAMRQGETHQTEARGRPEFLQASAAKLKRCNGLELDPEKNIIATLGCKQGLVLSLLSAIEPGGEVIIEDPCFVSYAPTIRLLGGVPVVVPLRPENGFRWDTDELEASISDRSQAILYCSPHNPAGTVHTRSDLDTIAHVALKHDLTVIADEIYESVTWDGRSHLPMACVPGMASRTIGLMGMTKSYSMGGWRIGYAYAAPQYIEAMTKLQQHLITCAGSFTQLGATRALQEDVTEDMKPLWADWEKRCRFVTERISEHAVFSTTMPEGGFYAWVDISRTGLSSQQFSERLIKEKHVMVVPGGSFGPASDQYIRITCVRSWDELHEGLDRIIAFADTL